MRLGARAPLAAAAAETQPLPGAAAATTAAAAPARCVSAAPGPVASPCALPTAAALRRRPSRARAADRARLQHLQPLANGNRGPQGGGDSRTPRPLGAWHAARRPRGAPRTGSWPPAGVGREAGPRGPCALARPLRSRARRRGAVRPAVLKFVQRTRSRWASRQAGPRGLVNFRLPFWLP